MNSYGITRGILSPLCLPIPPYPHILYFYYILYGIIIQLFYQKYSAKGLSPLGTMAGFVFATTSSGLSTPCDQHSNHFTLLLHISVFLRDFLCGRSLPESNREPARYPRAMPTHYTRLLIPATLKLLLYGQL